MGAAGDARLIILRFAALIGLGLVFTIVPVTVFWIRFMRYQRRHPWTPPQPLNLTTGGAKRRPHGIPRALEI